MTETICNKADWGSRHTANGKEKDWTSILEKLECIICFLDKNSRYTGIEKKNCWTSILEMIQKIEPLERHQFINYLMELSNLLLEERNQLSFLQENIPKHMGRELIERIGYQETYRNDHVLNMLANLYVVTIVLDQRYHILYSEKFLYCHLSFKPSKHIYISKYFFCVGGIYPVSIRHGHHLPASKTPFEWRFAGGPMVARDCMLAGSIFTTILDECHLPYHLLVIL